MGIKGWQQLAAFLIAVGVPAAVVTRWWQAVTRHPVESALIAIAYWMACLAYAAIKIALAGPTRTGLEQAGIAADRAARWWLSGYGGRYRQWVLDSRRFVSIDDLSIRPGDHTPRVDDIYVDVALVSRAPDKVSGNPLRGVVPGDTEVRRQLSDLLKPSEQVVLTILGPPGSGKSTLLTHTAQRAAQAKRRERRIPVLLALREHAQAIADNPNTTLPELIRSKVSGVGRAEPDGWWERQLAKGRCLVLLDGLDEVAREDQRRAVAEWVTGQVDTYRDDHFVITSRPHGYQDVVIPQAAVTAICPFTSTQIDRFLENWYTAAERRSTGATTKAELRSAQLNADNSVVKLRRLLLDRPALRDLAVNPLLLTMIAIVYREKTDLPRSRADLYREICQVMLSRRIRSKGLAELMPWEAKRRVLANLAFQMMASHVIELDAAMAAEGIEPSLLPLPDEYRVDAKEFLTDIIRNGLLVEVAPGPDDGLGKLAFPHLTFQEYLAAQHAAASPDAGRAISAVIEDPWWRETIILYAAAAEDASILVQTCLDMETLPAMALAFDCANASSSVDPQVRKRLADTQRKAYEPDCTDSHRRLIAGIEAMKLASRTIGTTTGVRVCDLPVPVDLYWLFLADTTAPLPDGPCEPGSGKPATGMRDSEARSFVSWLNRITASAGATRFRLPTTEELTEQAPDSVSSAWTFSDRHATLWVRDGIPHPHVVQAEAIQDFIAGDPTALEVMTEATCAHAVVSAIAIALMRTSEFNVKDVVGQVKDSLGREISAYDILQAILGRDFDRARSRARDRSRARARRDDRALAIVRALGRDRNLDRSLDRAFDFVHALDLGHAPALDLEASPNTPVPDRARDLDLDLVFDLARALDLSRDPSIALGIVLVLDRIVRDLREYPDGLFEAARTILYALPVKMGGISGFPLPWVCDGPLGEAVRAKATVEQRIQKKPTGHPLKFLEQLCAAAGVSPGSSVRAQLDNSFMRRLSDHYARPAEYGKRGEWLKALSCLAEEYAHPSAVVSGPAGAALIALALAADETSKSFPEETAVVRELAAALTLAAERANGTREPTETIVLALA